jgi:radical SAM superfamily enzyme YgiQ (UPF0313 family)
MKVALVTAKPNPNSGFNVGEKRPPTGIGFLYAVLAQHGIQADIYDRYCTNSWSNDNFESYDFMGIYCASVCSNDITNIITLSKAKKIAVGGPHAYIFPEKIPSKVNYIVRGEGEHIIKDLVEGNYPEGEIVTDRLSNKELDALPSFPYEVFWKRKHNYNWGFPFNNNKPIFTMNTSRGCPFSCSFCSVKKIWGKHFTYMSADRVFEDVERLVKDFGCKGIYFREDNFTVNNSRVRKFCQYLITNKINITFACETRVDTLDYELMELMRRAGCIGFYVGVEALNQHMLDIYNKGITVEQTIDFFKSTKKLGIKVAASLITNHPEETAQDQLQDHQLLQQLKPALVWTNPYRKDG